MTVPVEALCHHAHTNDMIVDMCEFEVGIGFDRSRSGFNQIDNFGAKGHGDVLGHSSLRFLLATCAFAISKNGVGFENRNEPEEIVEHPAADSRSHCGSGAVLLRRNRSSKSF
jgi:hypothetical protein